jgi:hypothetical protein
MRCGSSKPSEQPWPISGRRDANSSTPTTRSSELGRRKGQAGRAQIGRQSRTQRPQFQPRRLLQCHPGPQPSAIRSARRATPTWSHAGSANVGRAFASTATKTTASTMIAAIMRIRSPLRDMEAASVDRHVTVTVRPAGRCLLAGAPGVYGVRDLQFTPCAGCCVGLIVGAG